MSIFKTVMHRFTREEIQTWSSLRKTAYLLLPLLFYLLVRDGAEIALWAVIELLMRSGAEGIQAFLTTYAGTVQGLVNGLAVLCGILVIGKGIRAEIWQEELQESDKQLPDEKLSEKVTVYGFLAAMAFLVSIGVNILFYQLGITEGSQSFHRVKEVQYDVQFAIGLLLYGVVSPIAEEAVFRGVIYNRMKRCFSYGIALVVSALLFGCYHGNVVQTLYGSLLGLLIAYVYEIFGSFAAPVAFHSVANISVFVMTYHNSLSELKKPAALMLATVMLLAAAGILIGLKKKLLNKGTA